MENVSSENKKQYPVFKNFGEYLYYAYANLQMLFFAVKNNKRHYDQQCYMVRAKAFKAYKEGKWKIHNLLEFNVAKIKHNDFCWYCEKTMNPEDLTKDHVFARSKGGDDNLDNIVMVCKSCNSSRGNMDLFEWYATVREEWPPINVAVHYLKNIFLYSVENGLMDKHAEELDQMDLLFNWRYIPIKYPEPSAFLPLDD